MRARAKEYPELGITRDRPLLVELAKNPDVMEFYLGLTEAGERRSYRAVKHYKRRKRWL